LPLKYNEGEEIEADKLLLAKQELVDRFGAITVDPHPVQGVWTHGGAAYQDLLLKFVVDVANDNTESQRFFREFKETLKNRFRQLDVWIVAYPIRLV